MVCALADGEPDHDASDCESKLRSAGLALLRDPTRPSAAASVESTLHAIQNHLIEVLPTPDRRRFLDICEPVQLLLSEVLCEPDARTRHVYFPLDACISLITLLEGKTGLETGMVGREGMVGIQIALGQDRSPFRALVQGSGGSWRIEAPAFRSELDRSVALRGAMNRYLSVLMVQLATSAACLRFHQIGPRLARWLLMNQDRAHSRTFHVTQEFLAVMLGVRRVGITRAACELQRAGLIEYARGEVTVLDRAGLEAASCTCYTRDRKAYVDVLQGRAPGAT